MKKLLAFLTVATIMFACGEAGIQVNTSAEFPIEIIIARTNLSTQDIEDLVNDDIDESLTYSLDDVSAFPDLKDLEGIEVNQLSYEITGVEGLEESVEVGELTVELVAGGNTITLVSQENISLANIAKTQIPLSQAQLDQLILQLVGDKSISGRVFFDLESIPSNLTDLTMEFRLFFDTTVKIQQEID